MLGLPEAISTTSLPPISTALGGATIGEPVR